MKKEPYNESTYVRLISSILGNIDPTLPDIVDLANKELQTLHDNYHQSSLLSSLKNVYKEEPAALAEMREDAQNELLPTIGQEGQLDNAEDDQTKAKEKDQFYE
jgi:hypothetical protein